MFSEKILYTFFAPLIAVSWISLLYFSAWSTTSFFIREELQKIEILSIFLIAAFMLFSSFGITPIGGYDLDLVYRVTGRSFLDPEQLFAEKEIAPIFIKEIVDILSGHSIYGFIIFNRILPVFSMIMFYAGIRRAKLDFIPCIIATAVLFLNFNSLFNSSSLNTTPIITLAYISFSTAMLNFLNTDDKNPLKELLWLFSSAFAIVLSRAELSPIIFILMAACAIYVFNNNRLFLKSRAFLSVAGVGSILLFTAFCLELSYNMNQLMPAYTPVANFNMQFIVGNLAVILSHNPADRIFAPDYSVFSIYAALLLIFFIVPFIPTSKYSLKKNNYALPAFLLAGIYSCLIYHWQDNYPTEFIRHRMLLFIPFAYISAYSIRSICYFCEKNYRKLSVLFIAAALAYSALNIRALFIIDRQYNEDRDRVELGTLIRGQKLFADKFRISTLFSFPPFEDVNMKKYFFANYFNKGKGKDSPTLIYISPEDLHGFILESEKEGLRKMISPILVWGNDKMIRPGFYKAEKRFDMNASTHYYIVRLGIAEMISGNYDKAYSLFEHAAEKECSGQCFHVYKMLAAAAAGYTEKAKTEGEAVMNEKHSFWEWQKITEHNINTALRQSSENGSIKLKLAARQCVGFDTRFCERMLWNYISNPLEIGTQ